MLPMFSLAPKRGFGLIELMVSISIMALVSTIIITRQSTFNSAVLLRNQAYEVAFALREAQQLAVSGNDAAVRRYGVHFDTSTTTQHLYRLFADANSNGQFDAGEQVGLTGRLDSRFEIRGVSPVNSGQLNVVFTRPNFDAQFCARTGGCVATVDFAAGPAFIDVARTGLSANDTGSVRRVQVTQSGQISVVTY